jgi:UDP-2,3-diacylglucosamine pyrophosphatase LpxH
MVISDGVLEPPAKGIGELIKVTMDTPIHLKLKYIFDHAPSLPMHGSDRFVIVSDLHMGDGSFHDDFHTTSPLFKTVFQNYYFEKGFKLILNGDVEELQKFILDRIIHRWNDIYDLFKRFQEDLAVFKLHGNHDPWLYFLSDHNIIHRQFEALKFKFDDASLFFLHGHQSSYWLERLQNLNSVLLKKVVNPLKLKNFTLDLGKKGVTKKEYRLSDFSLKNKILTFMGHTHRPLFGNDSGAPALYNSGAAIGKKGITTLEIDRGRLNLVHWWGRKLVKRYLDPDRFEPERLGRNDIYRVVLNSRSLTEIFRNQGISY